MASTTVLLYACVNTSAIMQQISQKSHAGRGARMEFSVSTFETSNLPVPCRLSPQEETKKDIYTVTPRCSKDRFPFPPLNSPFDKFDLSPLANQ